MIYLAISKTIFYIGIFLIFFGLISHPILLGLFLIFLAIIISAIYNEKLKERYREKHLRKIRSKENRR